jgi:hypothetical protein
MIHLGHLCFEIFRNKEHFFHPYFHRGVLGDWWGAGLCVGKFGAQVSWRLYE